MAVALQATAPQTFGTTGINESAGGSNAVTVDAGSERCLLVLIGGEGDGTATQAQVSALTYNGVALTQLARAERTDWSWCEIWYLVNPATGSNTLALTLSEVDMWSMCVMVAQGVDQTSPMRTVQSITGSAATSTRTVPSVVSGDLVFDVIDLDGSGHAAVQGADQTEVMDRSTSGTETAVSTQPGSAGGVMSWTWTTSCPFSHLAGAFVASTGGASPQTVTVPLVDAGATVYAPTVTRGAVAVTVPLVDAGATVHSPTLTAGAVGVSPPLVDAGAAVFSPTLSPGPVTVTVPLVDSGAAVYSPAVTPAGSLIAPPLVDAGGTVYGPTLTVGAVTVAPPLVDGNAVAHAPTVTREGEDAAVSVRPRLGAG